MSGVLARADPRLTSDAQLMMMISGRPKRPMERIHQIEVTTECNLRCRYCPHGKMLRTKEHMSMETYEGALEWVKYFDALGTQPEVSLTGIGEPLMHPRFLEMVRMLREVYTGQVLFATNGLLMTDAIAEYLADYAVGVYVSTHRPEKAGPAINMCRRAGILAGSNTAFATSALDWAGHVDWEVTAPAATCQYLNQGWGVVLADGRISMCCLDAEAEGIVGHVNGTPSPVDMQVFDLCKSCSLIIPETMEVTNAQE